MASDSDIRAFIDVLAIMEAAIVIDDPGDSEVKHVYTYFPKSLDALELPAFMHEISLGGVVWMSGNDREETWSVRVQFYHDEGDMALGMAFALEFLEQFLQGIEAARLFATSTVQIDVTGGVPTAGIMRWNGEDHAGFEVTLAVRFNKTVTIGP